MKEKKSMSSNVKREEKTDERIDVAKEAKTEKIKEETVKREEKIKDIKKGTDEIKEEILKQQEKIKDAKEEKEIKKEKKLEEIVDEKSVPENFSEDAGFYRPAEKNMSYEYMFSYLGSGVRKMLGDDYTSITAADTAIALTNGKGKDVMDIKEQSDYSIKQATNMLLGTDMNQISHDEKIKFNAFMTDPSNKIVFLINYSLMGMNYRMPEIVKTNAQYFEVKMTEQEIKEKSMKNDRAIALRFDLKKSYAKEDVK